MSCPKLEPGIMPRVAGPVVIAVMDGVGIGRGDAGDAVAAAHTPNLDRYGRGALVAELAAHGTAVGMPSDEDMGNSEVGHNVIGAGRVFAQGAKLVKEAIESGRLFAGEPWQRIVQAATPRNSTLHCVGLLSDGNVHSHIDHVICMLRRASDEGVARARLHVLLDGRDVPKTSSLTYVDTLERALAEINSAPDRDYRIASGGGRMQITMDRYEADWGMVERGWKVHVRGEGRQFKSAREAIETFRIEAPGIIDQDLPPFVIAEQGKPVGPISDGDAVIAFNFRGDRMLEWVRAFEDDDLSAFERGRRPNVAFAGMTLYDGDTQSPRHYLVAPPQIRCTLGELLCPAGIPQLAVSETQKFGHVTYFWNGNRSGTFDDSLERYVEIPSAAPPFDAAPQMKANEITDIIVEEIEKGSRGLIRLNFANGDMVGHTGNFDATVRAVETVDACVGRIEAAVLAAGGAMIVTADHGNADDMAERDKHTAELLRDPQGQIIPKTAHSLNPVPFYVLMNESDAQRFELSEIERPALANIASTAATLLGFARPDGYEPGLLTPKERP